MEQEYLTEKEVSKLTRIALSTLRNHRFNRKGIAYVKIGRSIRYAADDIQRYMESHRIETLN